MSTNGELIPSTYIVLKTRVDRSETGRVLRKDVIHKTTQRVETKIQRIKYDQIPEIRRDP